MTAEETIRQYAGTCVALILAGEGHGKDKGLVLFQTTSETESRYLCDEAINVLHERINKRRNQLEDRLRSAYAALSNPTNGVPFETWVAHLCEEEEGLVNLAREYQKLQS